MEKKPRDRLLWDPRNQPWYYAAVRAGKPTWTWLATVVLFIIIMWLSSVPKVLTGEEDEATAPVAPAFARFVEDDHFDAAREVVLSRCSMCHALEPVWDGMIVAPKGVLLESDAEIAAQAREQSKAQHAGLPEEIMDVNSGAVASLIEEYGVDILLHGHTHRPAIHEVAVGDRFALRVVLGDWYEQGSVLRWDEDGLDLTALQRQ